MYQKINIKQINNLETIEKYFQFNKQRHGQPYNITIQQSSDILLSSKMSSMSYNGILKKSQPN